ncbi:hypothetical protein AMECASPLE_012642 [Ameca splendens]|uniref:Uncharacterized protein n=1 Tax=Ameca splendens TaxID=208324 RepID=A0ABV0XQ14_9TELE
MDTGKVVGILFGLYPVWILIIAVCGKVMKGRCNTAGHQHRSDVAVNSQAKGAANQQNSAESEHLQDTPA